MFILYYALVFYSVAYPGYLFVVHSFGCFRNGRSDPHGCVLSGEDTVRGMQVQSDVVVEDFQIQLVQVFLDIVLLRAMQHGHHFVLRY